MIISKNTKDIPIKDWSTYYVVADFDRTITKGNSMTSWAILSNSKDIDEHYKTERNKLYDHYRPIEIDETIDIDKKNELMKEWYKKHIELIIKYSITESLFDKAASDLRIMEFRPHAKEFIDFLHEHDIPLIIISAGVGNFIEHFLNNNNCYYDNIHVVSNKIIFTNGIASGVDENIIHSLNKNEVSLRDDIKTKLKSRKNVLLLGDQKSDLNMIDEKNHENVIKVCLLNEETTPLKEDYQKLFDILIEENEDYSTLMNILIGE